MKEINLFENLKDDAFKIFNEFIEINPIGSIVLNEHYEIVYINEKMRGYFDGNLNLAKDLFGNIFRCSQVEGTNSNCGTIRQCKNCNLRNNVMESMEKKTVIRNILWSNNFTVDNEIVLKWFDITLVPMKIGEKQFLWASMIDLTELMNYKIEYEMTHILTDEERTQEKNKFHNDVMNCITTNCHSGGIAYLVLIDLKIVSSIQEKFGSLWKNDYVTSVYQYIKGILSTEELICHYSGEQFLLFLPCKGYDTLRKIVTAVNDYKSKIFNEEELIVTRTIKAEVVTDYLTNVVNEDKLHLEYFKAISKLEQLEENSVYEVTV